MQSLALDLLYYCRHLSLQSLLLVYYIIIGAVLVLAEICLCVYS